MRPHHRFTHVGICLLILALALELFSTVPSGQAQGSLIAQATTPATLAPTPDTDDSDELPVFITLSGKVKAMAATSITVDDQIVLLRPGVVVPSGVQIGTLITIRGNLRNDDTVSVIQIIIGNATPTAAPTEEDEDEDEEVAVPTTAATSVATALPFTPTPAWTPTASATLFPGCNKAAQRWAVLISETYNVAYAEVVNWRCQGFSFGVIARAHLLVLAGLEENKLIVVPAVLNLRLAGKRWAVIIVELGVHPRPESFILVITGGQVVIIRDCKSYKKLGKHSKAFKDLYNKFCKKPKKPKK